MRRSGTVVLMLCCVCMGCKSLPVIEYKNLQKEEFSPAAEPARLSSCSDARMMSDGYVAIGNIDVRLKIKTCGDSSRDKGCWESVEKHKSGYIEEAKRAMLIKAAEKGGQIVVINNGPAISSTSSLKRTVERIEYTRVQNSTYQKAVYGQSNTHEVFVYCGGKVWRKTSETGEHPLARAVRLKQVSEVRTLCAQYRQIDSIADYRGYSLLSAAVLNNDLEVMEILIQSGARATTADRFGSTPVHYAAQTASPEVIARLISAGGARVLNMENGEKHKPVSIMIKSAVNNSGVIESMSLMISHGAVIESWHLGRSIEAGNIPLASMLLRKSGLQIRLETKVFMNKLAMLMEDVAKKEKTAEMAGIVNLVLGKIQNSLGIDDDNSTILHEAVYAGSTLFTAELIRRGVAKYIDLKSRNRRFNSSLLHLPAYSPLEIACYERPNADIVRLLLKHGGQGSTINKNYLTQLGKKKKWLAPKYEEVKAVLYGPNA